MPVSYASFRVDPSINFDNFSLALPSIANSPTVSNFSRPISIRPALSPNASHLSFAMSDSSRRSSYVSSKGPMTPQQEIAMQNSIAGPILATLGDDHHSDTPSFMMDSPKAPKLDLSFAVESVMRTYQPLSAPQSPARFMAQAEKERPRTAVSLAPAPVLKSATNPKPSCPVHGTRRMTMTPRPCPVHGPKRASTMPLDVAAPEQPRKSMSELPREMQRSETLKTLPALPFLQHDPFQSPHGNDLDRGRPKSAGADSAGVDPNDDDFVFDRAQPAKKQSAPSIMSTRSTRSIRKGFSRVRRMLARAKPT